MAVGGGLEPGGLDRADDAGVAAAVAAAVVEPTASYSLPTEVVGLIYDAKSRQVIALNGQGCAPGNMTIELFADRAPNEVTERIRAVWRQRVPDVPFEATSMMTPNPEGQLLAVQRAWESAGLDPMGPKFREMRDATVIRQEGGYLYAEYRSKLMRFVDDV